MTIFSTSTSAFYERSRQDMAVLRKRAEATQEQLSRGERLSRSSQDPVAASRLRTLGRAERLTTIDMGNANRASSDLTLADAALSSFSDFIIRARELAVQAGSDTMSDAQRAGIGEELRQIHQNLVGLANARDSAGHALFGGIVSGDAYEFDGAGNAVYIGTASAGELSLGEGQSIVRGVTGPEFVEFDDAGTPTNIMAVVKTLADALGGGSPDPAQSARDALGSLTNALDSVTTTQTVVGSRLAWIDLTVERQTDLGELRKTEEAEIGGTDIAGTVVQLQEIMLVLEASQASFSRLSGMSLFNSLR
ncbi:MAG: flagellar biosynthesis protein FlgL [Sphingomonadaceae bacterium]